MSTRLVVPTHPTSPTPTLRKALGGSCGVRQVTIYLLISPFTFNEQCLAICSGKIRLHLSFHLQVQHITLFKESQGSFCRFGTCHQLTANHASQIRHAKNRNLFLSRKVEIAKKGQQLQNMKKKRSNSSRKRVSRDIPDFLVGKVRFNSNVRLASCLPKHHSRRKVFPVEFSQVLLVHKSILPWCFPIHVGRVSPKVFPMSKSIFHVVPTSFTP